jgi:hypothetical protein
MEEPSRKRVRLSMACNACRQRKVKCDTLYPKCRRCLARNGDCLTTSTKESGVEIERTWLTLPDPAPSPSIPTSAIREPESVLDTTTTTTTTTTGPQLDRQPGGNDVDAWLDTLDVSYNTDHHTHKTKMLGVSSVQCLVKSVDVYLRSDGRGSVLDLFRHGMAHAEELHLDSSCSFIPLPGRESSKRAWSAFVRHIHQVYPLYDLRDLREIHRRFQQSSTLALTPQQELPSLMSVYLLTSIGLDDAAGSFTVDGTRYLQAAAHLLGPVTLMPYLSTVQCLLLLAIACHGRNKGGVAWQMLGIAIRIGHSLGLHQSRNSSASLSQKGSLTEVIWEVATGLEKMMQLECGRPSLIYFDLPRVVGRELGMAARIALARIQGQMNELIYTRSLKGRSTCDFLHQVGLLDRELVSLHECLPTELRFTDGHSASPDVAAHLVMQYHVACLSLHRAALVAPSAFFKAAVEKHYSAGMYRERVRRGESICSNSAQAIARMTIELTEQNAYKKCLSAEPPMLACTALAVLVLKGSSKLLRATNYEVGLRLYTYARHLLT